jgi:glyoxylase-like metal-dependent hydrolase (beta-lactamase superfamily II)
MIGIPEGSDETGRGAERPPAPEPRPTRSPAGAPPRRPGRRPVCCHLGPVQADRDADHLSAAPYLKKHLGGQIGIGKEITSVQKVFKGIFNLEPQFKLDGSQFDKLLADGESFAIGELQGSVVAVPGHTPACVAYQIGDAVFVGDTLFMPDVGTARCDFPGGDANTLYQSTRKLLSLPPQTRLFMCHDYPPNGRPVAFECTVADQRAGNIHVRDGISQEQFVQMRTTRDATLEMPVLILPAVQINIRAGEMPPKEDNGTAYVKIPLNAL